MAASGGSRQVLGRTQENNRAHLHERGAGVPSLRACQRLTVRPADPQAERRANLKRVVSFEEYASDPTGTLRSLLAELPYHERRRPDANALACAASHARSFACWAGGGGGGWVGTGRGICCTRIRASMSSRTPGRDGIHQAPHFEHRRRGWTSRMRARWSAPTAFAALSPSPRPFTPS